MKNSLIIILILFNNALNCKERDYIKTEIQYITKPSITNYTSNFPPKDKVTIKISKTKNNLFNMKDSKLITSTKKEEIDLKGIFQTMTKSINNPDIIIKTNFLKE